ncbi:shikimate 5-dehydrogenase [Cenarchaeum symbiosum A]|uniref:Shikimate dehydrogenase (NADP(+)) n=1 Tax=Cenarchaeum symbiosum (strain A) TaxID=414004 RepID=A0RU29_CENSY|nr:shikimate 5-dehydrogenase [Cenarchaeum symbiosum A]
MIGDPINHSLSPTLHNAAFMELGMDCTYIAYRIPRGELEEGIGSLKDTGVEGFNVTIPHKVAVMKYMDRLDETCSMAGAANTVSIKDGVLKGYNTDMGGFLDPIKKRGIGIEGTEALVLGAGGAARAVTVALAGEGARRITIANRTQQGAREIALLARRLGADAVPADLEDVGRLARRSKFIVNCTPVGMGGEPSLVPEESIQDTSVVYDIVYMPLETDMIKKAKARNAVYIRGFEMLLGQACRAFEIWHEVEAPYKAMKQMMVGDLA